METVYLDNNATTQPADEVVEAINQANRQFWANPSSMHRLGQKARQQIELARQQVASFIGATPAQIIFTSGGTESNNLAIKGILEPTLYKTHTGQSAILTTQTEHSAVTGPAQEFAKAGGKAIDLPVDGQGLVNPDDVAKAIKDFYAKNSQSNSPAPMTILVSIQWANNETGVIQPVQEIARTIEKVREDLSLELKLKKLKKLKDGGRDARPTDARPTDARLTDTRPTGFSRIYFHVDGTQAVGKIPVDVDKAAMDLFSFAGHKFHGPKGIGALYVKPSVKLQSVNSGGPQEREKRGGTENTLGIIGLGQAVKLAEEFLKDTRRIKQLEKMRDEFEGKIVNARQSTMAGQAPTPGCASVNGGAAKRLWNTSNIIFTGLDSEAILLSLSESGVCASAGAACSSGSLEPSPVLMAMGLSEPEAQSSVRFSISRYTTAQELEKAAQVIIKTVKNLRK